MYIAVVVCILVMGLRDSVFETGIRVVFTGRLTTINVMVNISPLGFLFWIACTLNSVTYYIHPNPILHSESVNVDIS